jgi:hypothetical protein
MNKSLLRELRSKVQTERKQKQKLIRDAKQKSSASPKSSTSPEEIASPDDIAWHYDMNKETRIGLFFCHCLVDFCDRHAALFKTRLLLLETSHPFACQWRLMIVAVPHNKLETTLEGSDRMSTDTAKSYESKLLSVGIRANVDFHRKMIRFMIK